MVEHRSPKPGAGGSRPSTPAIGKEKKMTNEQITPADETPKSKISNFVRETQREIAKITWPVRKEISMTTLLIVIFALITGMFFLFVDSVLGFVVSRILGMS